MTAVRFRRSGPEVLLRLAPNVTRADLFIVEPLDFATQIDIAARRLGVSRHQIHIDRYTW